jgi:hypothetical protein
MIFIGNIPAPLPPEDLLTSGDRDALASWFIAQKGINYSFQVIEEFLDSRGVSESPSSTVKPRQVKGRGDRQRSSMTPKKQANLATSDSLTPCPK